MDSGMIRTIDELGRVVIPREMRNLLGLKIKDKLEIRVNGNNELILKKFEKHCVFCDSKEDLIDFCDQKICSKCLNEIISNH